LIYGAEPRLPGELDPSPESDGNDDATLASGTRLSVNNEPPANFVMFTKKMAGSNNHFTRFHTDHLIRRPRSLTESKTLILLSVSLTG
jgi:hypothetical protein